MATVIVPTTETEAAAEYRLPEAHRQAILAESPRARKAREIERQRLAFIETHGCPFGQAAHEATE